MIEALTLLLRAEVPTLKRVGTVGGLAQAQSGLDRNALPAGYLHLVGDRAAANALVNAVSQTVTRTIGLALCVPALGQARTEDLADDLEPLLAATRGALLGFYTADLLSPLELVGGRLVLVAKGLAWWVDEYRTSFLLRKV